MTIYRKDEISELKENLEILSERWDWMNILIGILEDVLSLNDLKSLNDRLSEETKRSVV